MRNYIFNRNTVFHLKQYANENGASNLISVEPVRFNTTNEYTPISLDIGSVAPSLSIDTTFRLLNIPTTMSYFTMLNYVVNESTLIVEKPTTRESDAFRMQYRTGNVADTTFDQNPNPKRINQFKLESYKCPALLSGVFQFTKPSTLDLYTPQKFGVEFDFNACDSDLIATTIPNVGFGYSRLDSIANGIGEFIRVNYGTGTPTINMSVSGVGEVVENTGANGSGSGGLLILGDGTGSIEEPPLGVGSILTTLVAAGEASFTITTVSDGVGVGVLTHCVADGRAIISDNLGDGIGSLGLGYARGLGDFKVPVIPEYNRTYFVANRIPVKMMGGFEQRNTVEPIVVTMPDIPERLVEPQRKWGLLSETVINSNSTKIRAITYCELLPKLIDVTVWVCGYQTNTDLIGVSKCILSNSTIPHRMLTAINEYDTSEINNSWCLNQNTFAFSGSNKCVSTTDSIVQGISVCSSYAIYGAINRTICTLQDETIIAPQGISPWIPPPPPPEEPIKPVTPITPIRTYTMTNEIGLTLLDGTLISTSAMSLNLDVNSHSWTLSSTLLDKDQRDLIRPKEDGQLVIVIANVNDYKWTFLVEKITTNRSFNESGVSIQCRGLSAELSLPYRPNTSVSVSEELTNQQIGELLIPTELDQWELIWELDVWNIPPNTYEHKNTSPVSALLKLVNNCGGVLVPDMLERKFRAIPRYPVTPWDFDTTPPQFSIPEGVIFSLTESPVSSSEVNGVFINGLTNGAQGLVRLTSTAGDLLASSTSNSMMVEELALRALGTRIIAGEQPQPAVSSISTWCDGNIVPLFGIGDFVRIVLDDKNVHGIINSVSINATTSSDGVVDVVQQIGIGESSNNQYELFTSLVMAEPLSVVTIIETFGDRSRVQHVDGTSQIVRGTGIVDGNYYLKGGQLLSSAPNLPIISDIII